MSDVSARRGLWNDPQFLLLASARTVSVLGNGFARVALGFAVLALPGATPGRLSLVLACQALPQLVFVLLGGVIADRLPRARLMVAADSAGAAAYAGLAALVLSGHAPLAALCALAVVAGTATALFSPAMDGLVPLVVPADRLQQANGLLRVVTNTSLLLGLSLSGVVVAWLGAGWALAVNAASFVVSAALTARLRVTARPRTKASSGWEDLKEGWREFASRQWLWVVVAHSAVVVAGLNATVGVLGPLAAQEHLGGARAWSLIVAAQALGTVAGAALAVRVRVERPVRTAVLATFPAALPIALLAASAPPWATAAAMCCSGVTTAVGAVLWSTALQRAVPEEALSRVSSYGWFGALGFAPLGLLAAGPVAGALGVRGALACCAALVALAAAGALLSPQVREGAPTAGPPATEPSAAERKTA
ncbi:MFS transporter [Streptomyces apricus]|uniref:MFS transporter n=1 Tax=Streptomyces apricus TaxID=1828112 RepID=UPI001F419527|nr:MFS transporter [Streptomyces apricus]